MDKPIEFKVKKVNGKKVVEAVCETIENEDGTVDTIVHVPTLDLINNIKE